MQKKKFFQSLLAEQTCAFQTLQIRSLKKLIRKTVDGVRTKRMLMYLNYTVSLSVRCRFMVELANEKFWNLCGTFVGRLGLTKFGMNFGSDGRSMYSFWLWNITNAVSKEGYVTIADQALSRTGNVGIVCSLNSTSSHSALAMASIVVESCSSLVIYSKSWSC